MNMMQCPLHPLGCTDSFPQNQWHEHVGSEKHKKTVVEYICSENMKCENALIDLALVPAKTNESSNWAATLVDSHRRLMERFTNVIVENLAQSNLMHAPSALDDSSNLNRIYAGAESPSRALLEQMDRNPNYEQDFSSHQTESALNAAAMNNLSGSIAGSSTDDSVNHHSGQNQDPMHANEQQSIAQSRELSIQILQVKLDSIPVSTDGHLIWYIDQIFKKIGDAICGKKSYIVSSVFETVMHGHRLRACLHLNGTTDPKFISLRVHLDIPVKDSFHGTIEFVLVDQSSNKPLQHIKRYLTGEIEDANGYLGFDDFIDKNLLHQEPNRYVLNDSIWLSINIEQTEEEKLANLPANVRDALMPNSYK